MRAQAPPPGVLDGPGLPARRAWCAEWPPATDCGASPTRTGRSQSETTGDLNSRQVPCACWRLVSRIRQHVPRRSIYGYRRRRSSPTLDMIRDGARCLRGPQPTPRRRACRRCQTPAVHPRHACPHRRPPAPAGQSGIVNGSSRGSAAEECTRFSASTICPTTRRTSYSKPGRSNRATARIENEVRTPVRTTGASAGREASNMEGHRWQCRAGAISSPWQEPAS